MNQHKARTTVGLIGILLVLLSLLAVVPAGAAVAGAVALDKTYVNASGLLTITVTDADLNVAVTQTNEATDFENVAYSFPFTAGNDAGATQQVRVKKFPILDSNGDGNVNFLDVAVDYADLSILQVSKDDGLVTVKAVAGETTAAAQAYTLTYKAADVQFTPAVAGNGAVKVSSTQDTPGFIIVLKETGPDTGIFKATFSTAAATDDTGADDPTNATRPTIATVNGNIVTVAYTDATPAGTRTANATVETDKPSVTVVSPATGSATQNVNPKLVASFTDALSGVDSTTVNFVVTSGNANVGAISTTTITGGFQAETILSGIAAGETTVTWYATATDKAGTTGRSDSSTTTDGDQDHSLRVDTVAPDFAVPGAETGRWWDTSITITNKTQLDATKAKTTSILVLFNEALDGASVNASDFTVDGAAPISADWFSGASASVFLTVAALTPDKKPAIVLVGSIADKAGNSRASSANNPTAVDHIAPTLAVAVNPTLQKASTNVTIEVGSNETLGTAPSIDVNDAAQAAPALVGTNLFRLSYQNATAGRYKIEVTAQDTAANAQTAGKDDPTATGAILFEIDAALPAVTGTSPANNGDVFSVNPFISIDWSSEGVEYTGDTHKKVTLTKATLDGADVLSQVGTNDNVVFILAASGLSLGSHTLVFAGKDEIENASGDVTIKFNVKERPAFDVLLNPGWNLVSIPAEPADPAINAVIPATHPIDTVLAYDAATATWLVATRDATDGLLKGTLTTITSRQAYWVHTTSFQKLPVTLASREVSGVLPPVIKLKAGWNLVPAVFLDPYAPPATTLGDYLPTGSLLDPTVIRVYDYHTTTDTFAQHGPNDALVPGVGYLVYLSKDADLVP